LKSLTAEHAEVARLPKHSGGQAEKKIFSFGFYSEPFHSPFSALFAVFCGWVSEDASKFSKYPSRRERYTVLVDYRLREKIVVCRELLTGWLPRSC
jgi:hypothetical protein